MIIYIFFLLGDYVLNQYHAIGYRSYFYSYYSYYNSSTWPKYITLAVK